MSKKNSSLLDIMLGAATVARKAAGHAVRHQALSGIILGVATVALAAVFLMPVHKEYKNNKTKVDILSKSFNELQQKVTAKDAEIQKLTQDLKEKDDQINSLKSLTDNDEIDLDHLRENNEKLRDENELYKKEIEQLGSNIKMLRSKVKGSIVRLRAKDKKISKAASSFYELKTRDDKIIKGAMELVRSFMDIANLETSGKSSKSDRSALFVDMIDLTSKLEKERKARDIFVKTMEEYYKDR
jgi:chromosome segregation ATPase